VLFETLLGLSAAAASTGLTGVMRLLALSHGVMDLPNERSSHDRATPRGGGASIVLVCSATAILLGSRTTLDLRPVLAMLVGGTAVALVGFLDDQGSLTARTRFVVHLAAAICAVICLGGLPPIRIGGQVVVLGWTGHVLAVLGIAWTTNLFNFMDGIDGIAACEGVFVALAGSLLGLVGGGSSGVASLGIVLAASCGGFLFWNWPPARVFLGDVGSGYLGYVIAVLALAAARTNQVALWVWLTLGGVFFVDATVTLVRRLVRRERLHQAHRTHAYQWLARRWGSHRSVTIAVLTVNALWLLPCAVFAALHPGFAAQTSAIALVPLVALAIAIGSGRREERGAGP
jgi:Fuc2NAc and GlcNAc transferase